MRDNCRENGCCHGGFIFLADALPFILFYRYKYRQIQPVLGTFSGLGVMFGGGLSQANYCSSTYGTTVVLALESHWKFRQRLNKYS